MATAEPDSIAVDQVEVAGERIAVQIVTHDEDDPAAAVDFALTFAPDDGDPSQALRYVGYELGEYLAGAIGQIVEIAANTPLSSETSTMIGSLSDNRPSSLPR